MPLRMKSNAARVLTMPVGWYNDTLSDLNLILANDETKQREAQKYINEGKYISLFRLENDMVKMPVRAPWKHIAGRPY